MDIKNIISAALEQSMSITEYQRLMQQYAQEGKTSGEQKEDLIHYTKLNAQRSKRVAKTTQITEQLNQSINSQQQQTWLLITETWCGDAASSVPVLGLLADLNPNITLRVVLRDEQPELMNQFLTNGGKSIPKLIALDEELNVLFDWGPRPQQAQSLYQGWREMENRAPYSEFQVEMQKWYNQDKGQTMQQELGKLIS